MNPVDRILKRCNEWDILASTGGLYRENTAFCLDSDVVYDKDKQTLHHAHLLTYDRMNDVLTQAFSEEASWVHGIFTKLSTDRYLIIIITGPRQSGHEPAINISSSIDLTATLIP